jgi:hypothetical protein
MDLTKHPPRSPYNTDVLGMVHLARMIDKARAKNSDSLGDYWSGEDSPFDMNLLGFLGLSPQEFAEKLKTLPTDADVANWLETQSPKTAPEIAEYNERTKPIGSDNEESRATIAEAVKNLDPSRTDVQTFFDLMVLADEKYYD